MTQLTFSTDFVQLPDDSTGKKTGFLLAAVSGGNLYVPAGVVVGVTGQVAEVLSADPGASDNGLVVRLAGKAVVQGDVASGAADSGNPVKVGGRYNSTLPTLTDGQRGDLQLTPRGGLLSARETIVVTGTANGNGNGTPIPQTDLSGYGQISLQLDTITGNMTVNFEGSNNGTTWFPLTLQVVGTDQAIAANVGQRMTSFNPGGVGLTITFISPVSCRYFRTRVSSFSSGTVDATLVLTGDVFTAPPLAVGGDVGAFIADIGAPIKIGGQARTTLPGAVSNTFRVNALFDTRGRQVVAGSAPVTGGDSISNSSLVSIPTHDDSSLTNLRPLISAPVGFNGSAWDRLRLLDAFKTEGLSPDVGLVAATSPTRLYSAQTLAATAGSTVTWNTNGAPEILIRHTGLSRSGGSAVFEVTEDGTQWQLARVYQEGSNTWVNNGTFSSQANDTYRVITAGYRQTRVRVVSDIGGTLTLVANLPATYLFSMPVGDTPSGSADSGSPPIKVGGRYNSTQPTLANGQRGDLQLGTRGSLNVTLFGPDSTTPVTVNSGSLLVDTELPAAAALADTTSNPTTPIIGAALIGFNGSTWDRVKVANTGRLQVDVVTGGGSPPTVTADDLAGSAVASSALQAFDGTDWDRVRSLDAFKTASATPDVGLLAATSPDRCFSSVSLGTAASSTQVWDVNGADVLLARVGTTTTGTYIFEVTADGTNWQSAEVYNAVTDLWVTGQNLTPTSGDVFRVMCNGWRSVRVRTVTTLGATAAFVATIASTIAVIESQQVGPAPHRFGYVLTSKTAQYTTTQTGTALWTPPSGKKLVIISYQIQVGGTTAGAAQLWYGASGDTSYTRGTDLAIFDGEFAPSSTNKPGVVQTGVWPASAVDHILRVTTSAAINPITVTVWGYES